MAGVAGRIAWPGAVKAGVAGAATLPASPARGPSVTTAGTLGAVVAGCARTGNAVPIIKAAARENWVKVWRTGFLLWSWVQEGD